MDIRYVGGDYFRAMEIPLRQGRLFAEQDTRATPRVIVVDERMAAELWPGQNPIGKRVRTGGFDVTPDTPWLTVVGVVGRVKQDGLDSEPRMALYHPHTQVPARSMNVVIRSAVEAVGLSAAVAREIRQLDSDLPIYNVRTMTSRVEESLAQRRFSLQLLGVFAARGLGMEAGGA